MPATIIVTSVGTSLLTNVCTPEDRRRLARATNLQDDDLDAPTRGLLDTTAAAARSRLETTDHHELTACSAELAVLTPLLDTLQGQRVTTWLLHSDTAAGQLTASLLQDHLRTTRQDVQVMEIPHLRTTSLEQFQRGVGELARWCAATLPAYRATGDRVVFNVAGGFKSLSGYLQTIGMFYADETIYTFEGTGQLLRIPKLPISLQLDPPQALALRRLKLGTAERREVLAALPASLWEAADDLVDLSPFGEVVFEREVVAGRYPTELLPSPHPRLRYGDRFARSVEGLEPRRLAQVNERVDDLTRYLLTNGATNPARLDVKKLRGEPKPGCTHEFDAWSDGAASRGFLRFEDGADGRVLVLEELGAHL